MRMLRENWTLLSIVLKMARAMADGLGPLLKADAFADWKHREQRYQQADASPSINHLSARVMVTVRGIVRKNLAPLC